MHVTHIVAWPFKCKNMEPRGTYDLIVVMQPQKILLLLFGFQFEKDAIKHTVTTNNHTNNKQVIFNFDHHNNTSIYMNQSNECR
jgi:hypothetical protein